MAPQRLDIQPAHIADLLPDTFILERLDAFTFRFRLAGTRVAARLGNDLRGANLLDSFTLGDRSLIEHHFGDIVATGRTGVFTLEAAPRIGPGVTLEMIVLPLVHTGRSIDRLLCSLVPLSQAIGVVDRLFKLRLAAAEALWPPRADVLWPPRSNAGDAQLPLDPTIRTARIVRQDRRQFRVYDGGLSND